MMLQQDTAPLIESNIIIPDLDHILETAHDASYEPHNNGFDLDNDTIRLSYIQKTIGGDNIVDLWFRQLNPKIHMCDSYVNMNRLPESLICGFISCRIYENFFSIKEDGTSDNSFGIVRRKRYPEQIQGREEWFDKGTQLMRKAAIKYNLRHWYSVYTGQPELQEVRQPLLKRMTRYLLP